jgi:DNA-binding IclR family transcriptional regulator
MSVQIAHRKGSSGAQTATRALELLELFSGSSHPLSLAEIVQATDLNRSAAYRLIRALEGRRMIAREPNGRRYEVGAGLIAMSAMVLDRVNIRRVGRPFVDRIASATWETVTVHVRNGRQRVCVDVAEGRHQIRRVVPLGETLPLYAGPTGKAILAFIPPAELDELLAWAADEQQDVRSLRSTLRRIRQAGYLAAVGDRQEGVAGLSVPLFDSTGVIGALTVSGPSVRWNMTAMQGAVELVRAECETWSRAMGHVDEGVLAG